MSSYLRDTTLGLGDDEKNVAVANSPLWMGSIITENGSNIIQ